MRKPLSTLTISLLLTVGCSATRRTEGQWTAGKSLAPNPKILLLQTTGGEPEGAQKVTSALLSKLSEKNVRAVLSNAQESSAAAMEHAAADGFDYVLAASITAWGDEVGLTVNLLEVTTRATVATATHHAHKRPGHWPSDPEDFVPELADSSLSRIFGWTPKPYRGDPPH